MSNLSYYDEHLHKKVLYKKPVVLIPLNLKEKSKLGGEASFYAKFINNHKERVKFSHKLYKKYNELAPVILRSIFKHKHVNEDDLSKHNLNAQDIISLF